MKKKIPAGGRRGGLRDVPGEGGHLSGASRGGTHPWPGCAEPRGREHRPGLGAFGLPLAANLGVLAQIRLGGQAECLPGGARGAQLRAACVPPPAQGWGQGSVAVLGVYFGRRGPLGVQWPLLATAGARGAPLRGFVWAVCLRWGAEGGSPGWGTGWDVSP